MNGPARFKSRRSLGLEGELLAAGHAERPDPSSLQQAARRLGLPPSLLATCASSVVATTTSTATATATATTAGKLAAFSGLGALSTTKVMVVGAGIAVSIAVGTSVFRHHHDRTPRTPAVQPPAIGSVERSTQTVTHAPIADPPIRRAVTTAPASRSAPSRLSKDEAQQTPIAAAPATVSAVARFDDAEPIAQSGGSEPAHPSHTVAPTTPSAPSSPPRFERVVDPRLAREVASLDRARGLNARGQPASALQELDSFGRQLGYSALGLEAKLVRIDSLLAMGQREAAASIAGSLPWASLSTSQRQSLEGLVRHAPP